MRYVGIVALALLAVWAWESPLVVPLRLLVVLFHEGAHAAAAWATGGQVDEIVLDLSEAGHTLYRGGVPLVVLNAGYLGSLGIGLALVAVSRGPARAACAALGVLLGGMALWMPLSAGLAYAATSAVGLLLLARWGNHAGCAWTLRAIGVFSVLYALVDVQADAGRGDAALLAARTGVPALVWTVLWLLAGAAGVWALRDRLVDGVPARSDGGLGRRRSAGR